DVGRRVAQFLRYLLDERLQVRTRIHHGPVEALDLRRGLARMVEHVLLDRAEDRLDPMGDADHDTRTHADSFTHDYPVARFDGGQTAWEFRPRKVTLGRRIKQLAPEHWGTPPESIPSNAPVARSSVGNLGPRASSEEIWKSKAGTDGEAPSLRCNFR